MSAAKHTPKPWTRHEVQHRIVATHARGYRVTVAWMADPHDDAIPAEERDANARLIAAAPALLEALEMVRDADDDCHRDDLPWLPPAARSAIDAAIAAARGES